MENPNFGSPQPIKLSAGTHTLNNVYLILPNTDGCIITSLKRNDSSTNWAEQLGFDGDNLTSCAVPIEVEYPYLWSEIIITAGTVWVYSKLANRAK